jgi:chromosome segregation ATPase
MDSRVPKNEREWWAGREIEKLERELTETERQRFGADADRRRLRAEVERWKTVAAKMSEEREHNANEASRLRADVERLTAKIGNQADRIRYLEGATNHATGTPLSQAIARAEKAEAERDALAKDKARLDWLEKNWIHWPITQNEETIRAAIDAAMKGTP